MKISNIRLKLYQLATYKSCNKQSGILNKSWFDYVLENICTSRLLLSRNVKSFLIHFFLYQPSCFVFVFLVNFFYPQRGRLRKIFCQKSIYSMLIQLYILFDYLVSRMYNTKYRNVSLLACSISSECSSRVFLDENVNIIISVYVRKYEYNCEKINFHYSL